jgi:hypothetical protein
MNRAEMLQRLINLNPNILAFVTNMELVIDKERDKLQRIGEEVFKNASSLSSRAIKELLIEIHKVKPKRAENGFNKLKANGIIERTNRGVDRYYLVNKVNSK